MNIQIPVSIGELIDKITILEIKSKFLIENNKISNVLKELNYLKDIFDKFEFKKESLDLYKELYEVNLLLWKLEDQIRFYDNLQKFDKDFVDTAKLIYRTNDHRSQIKKTINVKFNSELIEEKSHKEFE